MSRIYEQLPCGCLVSEDGGGALIPCEGSGAYDLNDEIPDKEKLDTHNHSWEEYNKYRQTEN